MEQIDLKLYALIWGELILVPKRLVKYYVKPGELFCVALKVCAGHHLFGKLRAKLFENMRFVLHWTLT